MITQAFSQQTSENEKKKTKKKTKVIVYVHVPKKIIHLKLLFAVFIFPFK